MTKKFLLIEVEKSSFVMNPKDTNQEEFIKNLYNYNYYDILILTIVMEDYPEEIINQINKSIKILKKEFSHLEIIVILGTNYLRKSYRLANNNACIKHKPLYYVNPFWYCFYYLCIKNNINKVATEYNANSKKDFLYLIGKPDQPHRLEILYRLYKKNLLNNANWRFIVHNDFVKNNCRRYLEQLSEEEFEDFISKTQRSLDDINVQYQPTSSHYPGIPFDYKIFEDSKFQIIAETSFFNCIISEKTYISILNKRPFIMVSQLGHNTQLQQYGFKTFENYCLHQNYQIEDIHYFQRFNKIMENIEYWIHNIDKFYTEIKADVEHNYSLLKNLGKKEEKKIKEILQRHGINAEPNEIIKGYYIE